MPPLVIAHRGASGEAPENTLKAFELAHRQGADGVELDLFLTRDQELVITHDEDLERLTGRKVQTRLATLAFLKKLDFGEGEKIPTLQEFFDLFRDKFQIVNIEIKSTGLLSDGVEKRLVEFLQKNKLADRVLVSSFNALHLYRMRHLASSIKRGYLIWPPHWLAHQKIWIRLAEVHSMNLEQTWALPERLEEFKQMGKKIWVWTVNEEKDLAQWARKDVEAIITNYPARLRKVIKNLGIP